MLNLSLQSVTAVFEGIPLHARQANTTLVNITGATDDFQRRTESVLGRDRVLHTSGKATFRFTSECPDPLGGVPLLAPQ